MAAVLVPTSTGARSVGYTTPLVLIYSTFSAPTLRQCFNNLLHLYRPFFIIHRIVPTHHPHLPAVL